MTAVVRRLLALWLLAAAAPAGAVGPVSRTVLPNGLTVLIRQREGGRLAAARLFVRVGAVDERDVPPGTNAVLAQVLMEERSHAGARRVAFFEDQVGAGLRAQAQQEVTDFSVTTLGESLPDALGLLAEIVRDFRPPSSPVLRRLKRDLIQSQAGQEDAFGALRARVAEVLFAGRRTASPLEPSPGEDQAIDAAALERLYKSHYRAANMVLVVVSGLPAPKVLTLVQAAFKRLPTGPKPPEASSEAPRDRRGSGTDLVQRPVALAAVGVGCPAPNAGDRDYPVAAVLNALLGGGKASRLFVALREQAGLGYELGAWYPPHLQDSYLLGYVITQSTARRPDGMVVSLWNEARDRMVHQYEAIASGDFTDAELERAKRYLAGTYELRHQRAADEAFLLGWWESLGLGYEQDRRFLAQIQQVTKENVVRVAKDCLQKGVTTVVLPSRGARQEPASRGSGAAAG